MRDYSKRNIDYKNRKPKPINYDTYIQVRIDKITKDKLYEIAEKGNKMVSDIVRRLIEDYIKKLTEVKQ